MFRQTRSRAVIMTLCAAMLLFTGCGSGTAPSPVASVPANTNLNGNWLLVGTLPFTQFDGSFPNPAFGLSGSFNVSGSNVVAALSDNIVCGGTPISGPGAVISGSIAADGSIAMQTPSVALTTLGSATLTGTVPSTASAQWMGHITFSSSTSCPVTQSLDFTAVPIAAVTGTYTGTFPLTFTVPTSPTPQTATATFVFQQGATLPGNGSYSANALIGSVTLKGISCLTSGTVSATPGGVLGSQFVMQLAMNDGSTVDLLGQILDTGAARLTISAFTGSSGSCGTFFALPFTVTRQ